MRIEPVLIAIVLLHQFLGLVAMDWTLLQIGATPREIYAAGLEGALRIETMRYWTMAIAVLSAGYLLYAAWLLWGSVVGLAFLLLNLGFVGSVAVSGVAVGRDGMDTLGYAIRYTNAIALGGVLARAYIGRGLGSAGTIVNAFALLFYCYYFATHAGQLLDQDLIGDERISVGGVGATTFAAMVDALLLFGWFCRATDPRHYQGSFPRVLLWTSSGLGIALVLLTLSRGSLVALSVYWLVYASVCGDAWRRTLLGVSAVLVGALVWTGLSLSEADLLVRRSGEGLTTGRWEIWSAAIDAWTARPWSFLFGVLKSDGLHNSLIGMAATYGASALAFYVALHAIWLWCVGAGSLARPQSQMLGSAAGLLAAVLVLGLFENVVYMNISPVSYLYYAVGCYCVCMASLERQLLPSAQARRAALPGVGQSVVDRAI